MKKYFILGLTMVLLIAMATVGAAATTYTVGGSGNYGYDFAEKDNQYDDGGANFSDLQMWFKAALNPNTLLYAKIKSTTLNGRDGDYKFKEASTTFKYAPVNIKVGYFGYDMGLDEDIVSVATGDFKSRVGLQGIVPITKQWSAKAFVSTRSGDDDTYDQKLGNGAYAIGATYATDKIVCDFSYGNPRWDGVPTSGAVTSGSSTSADQAAAKVYTWDNAKVYVANFHYKPIPDLTLYFQNSNVKAELKTGENLANTNNILGVLYTPADSRFEFRAEYDLDNKNELDSAWSNYSFNPWGFRVDYKISPGVKLEFNRNHTGPTDNDIALKLNLSL